jgi:hypothetical protein
MTVLSVVFRSPAAKRAWRYFKVNDIVGKFDYFGAFPFSIQVFKRFYTALSPPPGAVAA